MRSLIIQAFDKCFVECVGCYNYDSFGCCSSADIIHFVNEIKKVSQINKITISGGEPLMRPDIVFLVEQLKRLGLYINFDTLGLAFASVSCLKNTNIEPMGVDLFLNKIDMLGIPMDGTTTEVIRMFRNKITINQIVNVLDNINEVGIDVCINTVAHQGNAKDIKNIYNIISNYECIKKWQIFEYMPIGPRGYANRKKYMLNKRDVEQISHFVKQLDSKKNIEFKTISSRKNNYILIDSNGTLWVPKMSTGNEWSLIDTNNERVILGTIQEKDILDKLIRGNWI